MPNFAQGYFCCKRRVLEFDEFLKIEGCAEGRHLFVRKSKGDVRDTRDKLTIFGSLIRHHCFTAGGGNRELSNRPLSDAKHGLCHRICQTDRQGTEHRKN